MSFYLQPSFFMLLAISVMPAAFLGLTGRSIKRYGLVVSVLFLLLLFGKDPHGLCAFLLFLVVSFVAMRATMGSWKSGAKSLSLYRVCLAATMMPLVLCKVAAVFDGNLFGFVGISYVTFKAIQVLIEVRDGLIEDMPALDWLYFLIFFAPFTSGPIDRSRRFSEDAGKVYSRDEYADLLTKGILLLLAGAVYQMVLAPVLWQWYTPAPLETGSSLAISLLASIKDAYAYGFFLFFDFAGYSLMVMGASYSFGVCTPRNFKAPFLALDVKDFWNRWHISLSTWLRDFVFMRFSRWAMMNKIMKDRLHVACCGYMINFTLMGAWHGLTLDYIVYGLYYGVLLCLTDVYQKKCSFHKRNKGKRLYKFAEWFVTINLVMLGMSIFSGQAHLIVGGLIHG